jgi:hypothetical protein
MSIVDSFPIWVLPSSLKKPWFIHPIIMSIRRYQMWSGCDANVTGKCRVRCLLLKYGQTWIIAKVLGSNSCYCDDHMAQADCGDNSWTSLARWLLYASHLLTGQRFLAIWKRSMRWDIHSEVGPELNTLLRSYLRIHHWCHPFCWSCSIRSSDQSIKSQQLCWQKCVHGERINDAWRWKRKRGTFFIFGGINRSLLKRRGGKNKLSAGTRSHWSVGIKK